MYTDGKAELCNSHLCNLMSNYGEGEEAESGVWTLCRSRFLWIEVWTKHVGYFLFDDYGYHVLYICVISQFIRPCSVLHGKNFYCWTLHANLSNFFVPAIPVGIFDLCHFIPLSVTLTLPGGHKVRVEQNLLGSCSLTLFNWSRSNLIWCWSNSSWTSWFFSCVGFKATIKITAVFLHFAASLIDHDLDSRLQNSKEASTSAPIISQSFQLIWMKCGVLLRRFGLIRETLLINVISFTKL